MSTNAQLFIDPLPELGDGAKRLQIDCTWGTTTAYLIPGGLDLTDEAITTSLIYRHEAECGRCNLAPLWKHADPKLRALVERIWEQLATMALAERRN